MKTHTKETRATLWKLIAVAPFLTRRLGQIIARHSVACAQNMMFGLKDLGRKKMRKTCMFQHEWKETVEGSENETEWVRQDLVSIL